jgi:hypothetical protein
MPGGGVPSLHRKKVGSAGVDARPIQYAMWKLGISSPLLR